MVSTCIPASHIVIIFCCLDKYSQKHEVITWCLIPSFVPMHTFSTTDHPRTTFGSFPFACGQWDKKNPS